MWNAKRIYEGSSGYIVMANSRHSINRAMYIAQHLYRPSYMKNKVAHHIDCNTKNDRLSNIVVVTKKQHNLLHSLLNKNDLTEYNKRIGLYRQK